MPNTKQTMKLVSEPVHHTPFLLPHDICCRAQGESVILVLARRLSHSSDADHKPDYLIILVAWPCLSWSNHMRGPEYISPDRRGKSQLARPYLAAWDWTNPKPTFVTTQSRSSICLPKSSLSPSRVHASAQVLGHRTYVVLETHR